MKYSHAALIVIGAMSANLALADVIPIDQVVLNDEFNVDHISDDPGDFLIDDDATLTEFDAGGSTYTDLQLVDDVSSASGSPFRGQNASSGGTSAQSVTDDRIDTGTTGVNGSIFRFASSPTSLNDVVFIFELAFRGAPDGAVIRLVDDLDAVVGSSVSFATGDWNGELADFAPTVGGDFSLGGIAITMDEFMITSGQLALVDGLEIVSSSPGLDPVLIGIATDPIPEPSSLAALSLLALFATRRTRRRLS